MNGDGGDDNDDEMMIIVMIFLSIYRKVFQPEKVVSGNQKWPGKKGV